MTAAGGGTEQVRLADGESGMQTISVKVPPGLEPGSKLRIKGQGHAGSAGGQAGDLILTVTVGHHPYFREGTAVRAGRGPRAFAFGLDGANGGG